ncbi:hypothetical protein HG536_0E04020 [Torulaspora globosa]|uniref:Zn(2)-C6 fungal-type domain-containing protein n=1 Tax=Torulaspora globosa TaxID=48254 RepID=A0A7G3ZJ05_9SACH|nr:uncharacterized protein HG536_0E04020 [Torulaspora globosa]QLL33491.1 hypothetical protein HG536_0E04020 [Torulaspora globosa]
MAEGDKKSVNSRKRPSSAVTGITKSISACKRCRLKKIRCDQEFPSCVKCAKAGEPCVSLDPATGRDVPRSYVIFLEDRLTAMMKKLKECGVDPTQVQGNMPATSSDNPINLDLYEETLRQEHEMPHDNVFAAYLINKATSMQRGVSASSDVVGERPKSDVTIDAPSSEGLVHQLNELDEPDKSVAALGAMKSNASNSYLGDSSGIPFAKLVFTAVNFRPDLVGDDSDEEIKQRNGRYAEYNASESSGNFDPVWLPSRNAAETLISRYFVESNSQLPVLHREYFLKKYYEPIYGPWDPDLSIASDHTKINTSFKLPKRTSEDCPANNGKHIDEQAGEHRPWYDVLNNSEKVADSKVEVLEEYCLPYFFLNMVFAIGESVTVLQSDIHDVVTFKRRAMHFSKALYGSPDRMEVLAGTILIAIYSLMRPNVPGVWYTMGSVLRLTVDLGLHAEKLNKNYDPFTRELRRRLFWCVYSLDRQICIYFGRPFGIPEENVTAQYPSVLDDALITTSNDDISDYSKVKTSISTPKVIALAMFKIRRIQASIVQVLYAQHGEVPRRFADLEFWRSYMHEIIDKWFEREVPRTHKKMNCKFTTEFFSLNYFVTKCMLYGLSPKNLALSDRDFEIVYDATKGTIETYDILCTKQKINYTWVAVHNIFMAGMTYLYVVYYSDKGLREGRQAVKLRTTAILKVLKELIGSCEAAKSCFIIYKVLSSAVIKLKFNGNQQRSGETQSREQNLPLIDSNATKPEPAARFFSDRATRNLNIKEEPLNFDNSLDQFFNELEKVASASENESSVGQLSNVNSPNIGDRQDRTDKQNDSSFTAKDGQRLIDMISQVTTESIWDELFGKSMNNEAFASTD